MNFESEESKGNTPYLSKEKKMETLPNSNFKYI